MESQTKFAAYWLYGVLAISAVNVIVSYLIADATFSASQTKLSFLFEVQSYAAIPYLIMLIGSVFVVARWIYSAANANYESGAEGLKYTPAWSVGWFFVPVMNIFKPYFALKEHYFARLKVNGWPSRNAMTTFHLWWGSWVASNLLSNRSLRISMEDDLSVDALRSMSFIDMSADIAQILCCLALIKIMKQFTQGHE
jgi:hypothetical protein